MECCRTLQMERGRLPADGQVGWGGAVNPLKAQLLNRQYDRRPAPPPRPVIVCAADVPLRRRGEIVGTYDYHAADGALLYRAVYFRAWSRRTYQHPDAAGGWVWGLKGVRRVLYKLPELLAADPAARVFIVPREKDADALAALGLVATCCPGGLREWSRGDGPPWERKWLPDWTVLAGRRVCIIIPNSKNVIAWVHSDDLAPRLAAKAAEVRVLALPGDCKSVAAWLQTETAVKGRRTHV